MVTMKRMNLKQYESKDGFLSRYQKLVKEVMLPYQHEVMHDRVPGVEKSHVVQNFINAAKAIQGKDTEDGFYGMVFQDSDAAKWLEAVAYTLILYPDKDLEAQADEMIDLIAEAQDKDGYLDTCFTIKDRERRWKNLMEGHEMYCMGHMMEAAVAYHAAVGKEKLLQVCCKAADHIYQYFITEKHPGYPGHPEIEIALLRMYEATGNEKYQELAAHFLNMRGVDPEFYIKEAKERDWTVWGNDPYDHGYQQCDLPVRDQEDAKGHSVRAVYLYTAMARLAAKTQDVALKEACDRLWDSITQKRMYVTGGIGSTGIGEAFTVDYDLPNQTAYAETCASIGLMFFALEMLEQDPDAKYADVMERAFYNTVLAGMQLDARRFFYVNPLEVLPGISGQAVTHKHDLPERPSWYACACCPPNIARIISSLAQYAYGENETTTYCNLFMAGTFAFENDLKFICTTKYPYGFQITYQILHGSRQLAVRWPSWSSSFVAVRNGKTVECSAKKGYVFFDQVTEGDEIIITLDDAVKKVYASAKVSADNGKTALQRGPLIYCMEGIDNKGDILSLRISQNAIPQAKEYEPDLLNGTVLITVEGVRLTQQKELYSFQPPEKMREQITAVPYYTWGNRKAGQMRVWIPVI